ncbi:MAG: glycoside hydrolase family 13 protein [Clostridia bacterium]|nr:glycoside hydrolase family 13 protein [Clostridia bacterium]
MNFYPFDSRNQNHKSKLGALAEGETLRLRLLLPESARVSRAYLMIRNDQTGNLDKISMKRAEQKDDCFYWECEFSLPEGIYWYAFKYNTAETEYWVTKFDHSLGEVSTTGAWWQLTVYNKSYQTPSWLDGGIIYQIFPDRFYKSNKEKKNVPSDRFIVDNWNETPVFTPKKESDGIKYLGNDYYGGDLKGIQQKLPHLKKLGVNCIYLNPIFEAHSNHRYNTANYMKIDSLLGDEKDLKALIKAAEKQGIYIILDGVFSHTGDDSIYFNKYKRYDTLGAYNSDESPYRSWYDFGETHDDYESWWGISTLPETQENDPSFSEYITGEKGVIRHWLKLGVKGFRLDVADELPDQFLDKVRVAVKADSNENFLLGEVWEDATNKISYNARRRFLRGKQLDSVMNYPFANAIINYLKGGNSRDLIDTVLEILENYPPQAVKLLMNHIGTHDTQRILTVLGSENEFVNDREWQSKQRLSPQQYEKGIKFLKVAAILQYTLPGVPSLYYGDEAGMEGYGDPFCRAAYPWGQENTDLLSFYQKLGQFRRECDAFKSGEFIPFYANFGEIAYMRKSQNTTVLIAATRWHEKTTINIPKEFDNAEVVFGNKSENGVLTLDPFGFTILTLKTPE